MIENVLNEFRNDLSHFLTKKPNIKGLLIKKHSEHLQNHGDFSFPNTIKSWHQCVDFDCNKWNSEMAFLAYIQKETSDIITESRNWKLEVEKVKQEKDRVYLFLNRSKSINIGLKEALKNNVTVQMISEESGIVSNDLKENDNSLTTLRLKCLTRTIKKINSITPNAKEHDNLIVTTRSSLKHEYAHSVLCGAVLNAKTGGKETVVTADDYIRMRQDEMILIAQHKYGVRVSTEAKWKEFIDHLGESAVMFDLLQTKPCSAVKINFECSSAGSSKGAAFILYNCARLEAIIRSYNEKVVDGTYPALPELDNIDCSLLTHEDEWCLVFNYIMGFPSLLENCVEINEKIYEFRPHLICGFLCSMVRVFSQYYRKVRILTEPRKHLLPVLFARLHMLKILNDTLKTCLNILNIKSVSQMYLIFFTKTTFFNIWTDIIIFTVIFEKYEEFYNFFV